MLEWLNEYKEELGAFIIGVGGVFGVVWGKIQSMRTDKAKTGADVAIAQSQKEVYEQLKERLVDVSKQLETMQLQIDGLRTQLREREDELHRWQLHVKDMEHLLVQHGIPVPQMHY